MKKYATAEILGAEIARRGTGIMRNAHRVTFNYEPKHGMLYVRSRMISSRTNDNFDEFPADDIREGWPTFLGKPVFVNHHNDDHRRARGLILDAAIHEDRLPGGAPDTWIEGLQEIDALHYPKLAQAIVNRDIARTSMGVDVAFSVCAACGNKATTPLEYCAHIPGQKGRKFQAFNRSAGRSEPILIRERCHGLRFFENSLLVEDPADPTAYFLGDVQRGPGLEHLGMTRTASRRPAVSASAMAMTSIYGGGDAVKPNFGYQPSIDAADLLVRAASLSKIGFGSGGCCPNCESEDTIITTASRGVGECCSCGQLYPVTAAGPRYPNPDDHPFFQEHPVSHDHVLAHWNAATDDEKASGKRWYPDAGLVAKALGTLHQGQHPLGNTHLAAGMLANYSPQTGWAANQHNAARALHDGKGIGGPGSGIFASDHQRKVADKLLGGADHREVMKSPKVSDFAHLIEHGGDEHPEHSHVVIDRHALAVASQHPNDTTRLPDDHYDKFPKTQQHYYGHVVNAYHHAAQHLSEHTGEPIAGHMVQATTWLVRQRLNQSAEKARANAGGDSRLDRGREHSRNNAEDAWSGFKQQHLPDLDANPGTGYAKSSAARGRRTRFSQRATSKSEDDRIRTEGAGPRYPDPADHPVYQQYQPSPEHIVNHYDDADASSRHQGGRWFEDAHHIAAAVGAHTGVGKHVAAGLFAAYSPQMQFHPAIHNATRAMHEGEPVQPGQGPYVTRQHATSANKILQGTHHQEALGGAKSQDMAHLIEHGGRDPETGGWSHRAPMGHVEFAVASGMGYSDPDTEKDARKVLGNRHYYDHLSGMYHAAAQHLNERDGTSLAAHHVQATCALHSAALADADDGLGGGAADRDRASATKYITKQHPDLGGNVHLSYGEVKAPAQVDTLRDEACPVCGETEAWDGDKCMVCGFVAPPDKFQDPNVDLAKQVDLRAKDDGTLGGGDVPGLNNDINDADGDGLDDNTGLPVDQESAGALDQQPMLTCPVCGFQAEGAEPMSINTGEPQGLPNADTEPSMDPMDPAGSAAEGDVCPNCGKGVLESAGQLTEEGMPTDADGDPAEAGPDDESDNASPFGKKADPDADAQGDSDADVDGDEKDNSEDGDDEEDEDDEEERRPKPRGFR